MRLAFATAFAVSGEAPGKAKCRENGRRNFDFVRSVVEAGRASGELDRDFSADELTLAIYGLLNSYVMFRLLTPECPLDRRAARQIVRLFVQGAASQRFTRHREATPERKRSPLNGRRARNGRAPEISPPLSRVAAAAAGPTALRRRAQKPA